MIIKGELHAKVRRSASAFLAIDKVNREQRRKKPTCSICVRPSSHGVRSE